MNKETEAYNDVAHVKAVKAHEDVDNVLELISLLDGEQYEQLLLNMSASFLENADVLLNLNVDEIAKKLAEAAALIHNRGGN